MKEIQELYETYGKKIFNYFYYLIYDVHKANDLTQETFYQALISIFRFRGDSSASTWLFCVARNVYLKYLRNDKNTPVSLDDYMNKDLPDCGYSSSPEEAVLRRETIELVRKAVGKLPENYAQVLVLRDKEGFSYKEISDITGISEAIVKVNIFRARQRFKEEFTKLENGYYNDNKRHMKGGLTKW